jgi:peroxiredoxin Q/BCP
MSLLDWIGITKTSKPLEVGDTAPDAPSRDEHGREVRLADFYHDGFTLVYFYPKADTPGCTAQACNLRDGFGDLTAKGVKIAGVSADAPEVQLKFKEKYKLPFTLLADEDRVVSRAFGVPTILGMTHRQSFLVKGGKIVWRDLRASTRWQTQDVLKALETLRMTG